MIYRVLNARSVIVWLHSLATINALIYTYQYSDTDCPLTSDFDKEHSSLYGKEECHFTHSIGVVLQMINAA